MLPTASMVSPLMMTTALRTGARPDPSINVTFVIAVTASGTDSAFDKFEVSEATCHASQEAVKQTTTRLIVKLFMCKRLRYRRD